MAIDTLQEKIRKLKNPSVIDFGIQRENLPAHLLTQEGDFLKAYTRFCRELMAGLRHVVPAVRFSFGAFALLGPAGLESLTNLMHQAGKWGYYVILDAPEILSPWGADRTAETIFGENSPYPCDGLVVSPYIGSDGIKPFLTDCRQKEKELFLAVRSPNKTASELQDLMTGTRLVHTAAADIASRHGENLVCACGYSRVCALASAGFPESLKQLRTKYPKMFLLVDGLDYPSGNAKNCSYAFDRFGHGAVVCAGPSVTAAWQTEGTSGEDYVQAALQAAERMKKNITRYITVM